MSRSSRAIVTFSPAVKRGEIFSIRAIVQHEMESGFRHTEQGALIPRDIIREFLCTYNGREVFRAELFPGTGSNPLFIFDVKADASGTIECRWIGDNDYKTVVKQAITVT